MKVKGKVKKVKSLNWDEAIADAEKIIVQRKVEIDGLKDSIQVFKARREAGVPFPGQRD